MARRRRVERDPWANTRLVDAIQVVRAEREERDGGRVSPYLESSVELVDRLGFDSVEDMRRWAAGVWTRAAERSVEHQRRQAVHIDGLLRRRAVTGEVDGGG